MSDNNENSAIKLLEFQHYQLAFTKHLRQPKSAPKPAKISAKGMAIYTEIVFNNVLGSVSACFPVAQLVLGKRAWNKLVREFFIHHQAQTPIFREVPQEFLTFLDKQYTSTSEAADKKLPPYLKQLAHYEWIELALSTSTATNEAKAIDVEADLLTNTLVLAAASALLQYDYPVHKISKKFKPTQSETTFLLVFRDTANKVQFIELNAVTFRLLQLIKETKWTSLQVLTQLSDEIKHPSSKAVITFGIGLLQDLKTQGAIFIRL